MDCPINTKINDSCFTKLLAEYKITPQGKKNTVSALRKLVNRSGKDIFYITKNDAKIFYEFSCINDILNGTYRPLYIKTLIHSLKAFYKYINELSANNELEGSSFPCCYNGNPFDDIIITIPDKLEYHETDFPSIENIDTLLSLCPTLSLKAAVCLAFKMCLTISDISTLKKKQIIMDGDKMYIKFVCKHELGDYPRYLAVPDDLYAMLQQLCNNTEPSYEYLLISKRHTPCAVRTLEHALNKIVTENNLGNNLTFSSLRNMGIRILLNNGALPREVADYLGIQGKWLSRYENVPRYLIKDVNKFSNIEIKQTLF